MDSSSKAAAKAASAGGAKTAAKAKAKAKAKEANKAKAQKIRGAPEAARKRKGAAAAEEAARPSTSSSSSAFSSSTKSSAAASGAAKKVLKRPASAPPTASKATATAIRKPKEPRPRSGSPGARPEGSPELLNPVGSKQRKVLILYTGGTLGMQDLGNGSLGPIPGALVKSLRLLDELKQPRMPQCFFVEFDPILDSADMNPEDWTAIARAVDKWYYEYDGFVVLHGTDTLAYTASALSFMLENLAKPVIMTGAQLPIFEPISDARQNFLGAVVFAGLADLSEVCVFFNGSLLRGNRSVKASACSLSAFTSPSYPPLAELGAPINIFRRRLREPPRGRFRLQEIHCTDVLVVWVIPGFSDDFFVPLLNSRSLKGMVLLLYGCGNAPARKERFLWRLKQLVDSGVVVIACSQCTHGSVVLEKYAVGKAFMDCGVVGARDMTTEAAVTKLAYLLSKGLSPDQCRRSMGEDLRGEMSTEVTTFTISEPVTGLASL